MITPGVWHQRPWFDGKAMIVTGDSNGGVAAVIAKVEDIVGLDDANLIMAAPKLLDACQQMLEASDEKDELVAWLDIYAAVKLATGDAS